MMGLTQPTISPVVRAVMAEAVSPMGEPAPHPITRMGIIVAVDTAPQMASVGPLVRQGHVHLLAAMGINVMPLDIQTQIAPGGIAPIAVQVIAAQPIRSVEESTTAVQ